MHPLFRYLKQRPSGFIVGFSTAANGADKIDVTDGGAGSANVAMEHTGGLSKCDCNKMQDDLDHLQSRFDWQSEELQRVRHKCLPGR